MICLQNLPFDLHELMASYEKNTKLIAVDGFQITLRIDSVVVVVGNQGIQMTKVQSPVNEHGRKIIVVTFAIGLNETLFATKTVIDQKQP